MEGIALRLFDLEEFFGWLLYLKKESKILPHKSSNLSYTLTSLNKGFETFCKRWLLELENFFKNITIFSCYILVRASGVGQRVQHLLQLCRHLGLAPISISAGLGEIWESTYQVEK